MVHVSGMQRNCQGRGRSVDKEVLHGTSSLPSLLSSFAFEVLQDLGFMVFVVNIVHVT